jgi:hypothetical protein
MGSKLGSFGSLTSEVSRGLNFLQSNPTKCGFIVQEVDSETGLGNKSLVCKGWMKIQNIYC